MLAVDIKVLSNAVYYPFYADFLLEKESIKVAVFVLDYSKHYSNIKDLVHLQIRLSMEHFKKLGYSVVEVNYEDYMNNERLDSFKAKLTELLG